MAYEYQSLKNVPIEELVEISKLKSYYADVLKKPPSEGVRAIPFLGENIHRYQLANYLEASFFYQKTDDPVIDQKMMNAFLIRDYEVNLHLTTGFLWSAVFYALPAWRGFALSTRLTISALPFAVAAYRGFRRGYDQINYVGETYMEHHLKKAAVLRHLRDHDDFLPEFKQYLLKNTDFNAKLAVYGIKPLDLPSRYSSEESKALDGIEEPYKKIIQEADQVKLMESLQKFFRENPQNEDQE